MRTKTWFTAEEAAQWLSSRVGVAHNARDVLRLAETGRLPVCFRYRGWIGLFERFKDPVDALFPIPVVQCFFDGYLQAEQSPSLERQAESLRSKALPSGRQVIQHTQSIVDVLVPTSVGIRQAIKAHPDMDSFALDASRFVGRLVSLKGVAGNGKTLSRQSVPVGDWLFHADDLESVGFSQGDAPEPVDWEKLSQEEKISRWKSVSSDERVKLAMMLERKHRSNKTAAGREVGISGNRIGQILNKADAATEGTGNPIPNNKFTQALGAAEAKPNKRSR